MRRRLLALAVVAVDGGLMVAAHPSAPPAAVTLYLVVAAAVAVFTLVPAGSRWPAAALALALLLASMSGSGHVVLLWAAYQAGRSARSRTGTAATVGASLGGLAAQLAVAAADPRVALSEDLRRVLGTYLVFVALPLLAGAYVAEHDRLVASLRERNRELRAQRHLVAEQERLRERLRIARDMHDSLGQRLSLVSVQAAALEVSDLPDAQRTAARQLAQATRTAMSELHELVGALRRDPSADPPGPDAIRSPIEEFRAAGVAVALHEAGTAGMAGTLPASGADAAYRMVQEGLTNAARHAPGQPVTVRLDWEPDALLVAVTNPTDAREPVRAGHGLTGLAERVELAGGYLEHRLEPGGFRLFAMLPRLAPVAAEREEPPRRGRSVAIAVATAVLMFVVLPAGLLLGVR
jgi:signal transduction histidine kinase